MSDFLWSKLPCVPYHVPQYLWNTQADPLLENTEMEPEHLEAIV